jgi:hypothetical protein
MKAARSRSAIPAAMVVAAVAAVGVAGAFAWLQSSQRPSGSAPPADETSQDQSAAYTSITDNEWTVVALLSAAAGPVTPDGPYFVLQQGVVPASIPVERPGHPESPCANGNFPRDRTAVHLPATRVVYLGVTFPGMDPATVVRPTMLGRPATVLVRATQLTVQLAGMPPGGRYTVPATGPGAAVLFAIRPPEAVPSDTYRFEIAGPASDGRRYVYACVDA